MIHWTQTKRIDQKFVCLCAIKSPEALRLLCNDSFMKLITDFLTMHCLVLDWWSDAVCYVDRRLELGKATGNCTEKVSLNISFQVFLVVFWVFTPYNGLCLFWHFRGMYCLHLQDD